MENYREFWEPALPQAAVNVRSRTDKKYFGKIFVTESDFEDGKTCFTDDIKESIVGNENLQKRLCKEVAAQLKYFFAKYKIRCGDLVIVAGVGNEHITADSLGCLVCDGLYVTSHFFKDKGFNEKFGNLSSVKCGMGGTTGIESYVHLASLCEKLRPALVIVVDTLSANRTDRLSSSVQISDCGITPGNGVGRGKKEFSSETLPCPVIAVGVPLVIYAQKILVEYCPESAPAPDRAGAALSNLVVTGKDVDFAVKDFSKIIADGINKAVHEDEE